MPIVRLEKVSLSFGLKPLLDNVALQIRKGERVCLLGRNGEGKSSLLRVIAREITPDSGEVWIRPGAIVASLAQEVADVSEETVLAVVKQGVASGAADADWQAELQVESSHLAARARPRCTASRLVRRLAAACDVRLGRWSRRRTCCCWTSPRTTSISTRSRGSKT